MNRLARDATVHLARLLHAAAQADDEGEPEAYEDLIRDAAELLLNVYELSPQSLPAIFEVCLAVAPLVRPGDLAAAAEWASDAAAEVIGCAPALLHPQCPLWIALACAAHDGADPHHGAAAQSLKPTGAGFTRPGGLPVPDELANLAGECTSTDLHAMVAVLDHHGDAITQRAGVTQELLGLLEGAFAEGGTVGDAVDRLSGADRVRAEELLAAMPAMLNVGRSR